MSLEEKARNCAIKLLARREHSRHELRQKLLLRKFTSDLIDAVLNWLLARGYQSDVRFVQMYIETRMRRGYGALKIEQELRERGIDDKTLIKQFLPTDEAVWQQQLLELCDKKFDQVAIDDWAERAKQMRFFQARGFTNDQIKKLWLKTKL